MPMVMVFIYRSEQCMHYPQPKTPAGKVGKIDLDFEMAKLRVQTLHARTHVLTVALAVCTIRLQTFSHRGRAA